ncbi:MAG: single-stranded-DNA-specific exonuclease RecJ [Gammaproteobacteria bacterium]|nr:single-stranded-DNA-specific exonuclease RecJ [Gammaproteobacteria bacterium]
MTGSGRQKKYCHREPRVSLDLTRNAPGCVSPLLKRIFENRDISDPGELEYPLSRLHDPAGLKHGAEAVEILHVSLQEKHNILIIGDYDADGATATALGLLCLRSFGAGKVDYLVPNRFEYGYGLSEKIAEVAIRRSPDLVITVDNGISSIAGVDILRAAGVRVIITDHHLPGPELPRADVILNPNQPGCPFPSKALSGVGVMFYLLVLFRAKLNAAGWFQNRQVPVPNLAEYLDLVALGTVADLVPLDYNNRILVARGLARIRAGKCRPGMMALLETSGRNFRHLTSRDLGFAVAPRLNAAGRMEDISTGIECLVSESIDVAREFSRTLETINRNRQKVQSTMQADAMRIVAAVLEDRSGKRAAAAATNLGFCLVHPDWHQGITGLVASRIREKTDEPTIVFAASGRGRLSGSARSVGGLHIRDLLENIASENPGLIEKFGGHAMAAGLTIHGDDFDSFEQAFHQHVNRFFNAADDFATVYLDGCLAEEEITLENAEDIRMAAPWGQGFPAPLFEGTFDVLDSRIVGEQHLRLALQSVPMNREFEAIAFRVIDPGEEAPALKRIHAVYELDVNEFRGKRRLQLIISHYSPAH